jgi:hypothetical protein
VGAYLVKGKEEGNGAYEVKGKEEGKDGMGRDG